MDIKNITRNYFSAHKEVLCVYLFGSAAKGKENKFSDVDIAVLFDFAVDQEQYSQKKLSIMDNLSRSFDRNVDVVVLNEASSFLKFQIIKNGLRIYEHPKRTTRDFEARAIMEYFDYLPIRQKLEEALIAAIKEA